MAANVIATGAAYSTPIGLIYIFNLIVGTGALAMPLAFSKAGWLISFIVIVLLACVSFITATFVIEVMASGNAYKEWEEQQAAALLPPGAVPGHLAVQHRDGAGAPPPDGAGVYPPGGAAAAPNADEEKEPLLGPAAGHHVPPANLFDITRNIEMGLMAKMFYNQVGLVFFYICIALYLYGDLAIYAAAVPKSLRNVACTFRFTSNMTNGSNCNISLTDSDLCWPGVESVNRGNAYRIFLAVFALALGPFTYFDMGKTKILQLLTSLMRWLAFGSMITLAVIRLAKGQGQGHPPVGVISGIPNLFGVCVYSFMCHHSLPSLVTPIRNKHGLFKLLAGDYTLILIFYAVLSFTGIFAFSTLQDLYTLNFGPDVCESGTSPITNIKFFQYFLALFPVFTLSTNFPIISITLRNNLKAMYYMLPCGQKYYWAVDRILFPSLAIAPPILIALGTDNVGVLVGITGSYAGAGIQYIIPATLLYFSRKKISNIPSITDHNPHRTPFSHNLCILGVLSWAVLCIGFVTVNHIITGQ